VAAKLQALGVDAHPEEILTSALATAALLRRERYGGRTAFVIGERGIREALAGIGVEVLDGRPERADLVIVGFDRSADYGALRTASLLVERGARLVATNPDGSYPAPDGLWPGAGALLAAITATTGADATIVGKPAAPLFEAAREATGARRPLVVGDRLDTDVAGAAAMGWDSLLVLTGASTEADLARAGELPTYLGPDVAFVLRDPPPARFRAATPADVAGVETLLREAGLSAGGLDERWAGTFVLDDGEEGRPSGRTPAATGCLEPAGGSGIVRSVAIRPDLRGLGLGHLATAHAIRLGRRRGIERFFLFTTAAAGFFARLGFHEVDRDALPEEVRTSRQAVEECAADATSMALDL
jgi:HAD superfamily hydrolase (TIGR01450 family)